MVGEGAREAEGRNPAGGQGAPMAEELIPIVQRAYDFAVDLHGAVNRFPRAHKPLLGRELIGLALRLLLTLVTANRRRDKVPDLDGASGAVASGVDVLGWVGGVYPGGQAAWTLARSANGTLTRVQPRR